jgi:hypothetical protein
MTNLVDYMLDLNRNPDAAQAFIDDPNKALSDAGFPNAPGSPTRNERR